MVSLSLSLSLSVAVGRQLDGEGSSLKPMLPPSRALKGMCQALMTSIARGSACTGLPRAVPMIYPGFLGFGRQRSHPVSLGLLLAIAPLQHRFVVLNVGGCYRKPIERLLCHSQHHQGKCYFYPANWAANASGRHHSGPAAVTRFSLLPALQRDERLQLSTRRTTLVPYP